MTVAMPVAGPRAGRSALPFAFVADDHPFASAVERFAAQIAADASATAWLGDPATVIHTELKGAPLGDGAFAIDRIYCSLQRSPRRFEALSLAFTAKQGATAWYSFPDEPYLAGLRSYVEGDALVPDDDGARFEVLRYVPLRRFTFRGVLRADPGRAVIGKFKRRSRVHEAHDRASAVARAAAAGRAPFAVPAPLGVDEAHSICFQSVVIGTPLSELATGPALEPCLSEAGQLQRAFHRLPRAELPAWDQAAFLAGIERDLAWVAFLRPETADTMDRARRAVKQRAPGPAAELVACHGDFVCSHLLRRPEGWAIIDLDLACRADPMWEVAMALAALPRDVPALAAAATTPGHASTRRLEDAVRAYLGGYGDVNGAADARRLRFWRLCAEAYELALMLTKDRYDAVAFKRGVARVAELTEGAFDEGAG